MTVKDVARFPCLLNPSIKTIDLGSNIGGKPRLCEKPENGGKKLKKQPTVLVGMKRRVEVWRNGKLIDRDEKDIDFKDLVVDAGLNALCGQAFDSSGNRPAVFNYVAIGTDGTTPSSSQTALGAEVMRVQGTYSKDANMGECSMDATFNITSNYALQECGLFNASSGGTMYCRDTYTTKNVVSGDVVKIYYTAKFQRPT